MRHVLCDALGLWLLPLALACTINTRPHAVSATQVIKKVKEHHRKKRRELKKSGNKPKEPKDPGIPSQWPFKEELLKELAWKRQQILMQEKAKKEDRKRAREVISWINYQDALALVLTCTQISCNLTVLCFVINCTV